MEIQRELIKIKEIFLPEETPSDAFFSYITFYFPEETKETLREKYFKESTNEDLSLFEKQMNFVNGFI